MDRAARCPSPPLVKRAGHAVEFFELAVLFFFQWMALAAWMVPLTLVLRSHGLGVIQPYAFATSAIAAFVSPLFFGAMADRHVAPARVLRWLSLATAAALTVVNLAIQRECNAWLVLGLIQIYALCVSPLTSISTAIAMSTMVDPRREFGPIRAMGTIGWMAGCVLVSALNADTSTLSGFSGAAIWVGLALFTYLLPNVEPPQLVGRLKWYERLGLDALSLLNNRDHRVMFLTTMLLTIPVAAFYPHTPSHLHDLGFGHPSAWMSLGQTTEIVAMFTLGALLARWRLKWVLALGLVFAVVRFLFSALDQKAWLLVGIALHGCSYTLIYTTAQIYVNERVDTAWRTRGQALMTLMNSGIGNLLGYLGTGWWFNACTRDAHTRWPLFWNGLAAAVACVMVYFLTIYRGRGAKKL